jgi:acyl carrier protein
VSLRERLRTVFAEALELPLGTDIESLRQWEHDKWDSLAHLALVTTIEEKFGVDVDADQLIELDSFAYAEQMLRDLGVTDED